MKPGERLAEGVVVRHDDKGVWVGREASPTEAIPAGFTEHNVGGLRVFLADSQAPIPPAFLHKPGFRGPRGSGSGLRGPKGDTGARGAKGEKGSSGGARGATGAKGAKGEQGDEGATGAKGAKGDKGAKGATR